MQKLKEILSDCAVILGAAGITLGAGMIYKPLGWIIGGIALVVIAAAAVKNGGEDG